VNKNKGIDKSYLVMLFIEDIGHIRRNNLIQTTLADFLRK
jgi:hypothetical protein